MKTRLLMLVLFLSTLGFAQTYTFSTIYVFPQSADGSADSPGGLIIDSSGNMYTSACCTDTDNGLVIKVTPQGVVSTLYTFTGGQDGGGPAM